MQIAVNETQMALAINAVNNDGMDIRSAARAYGVKKSTLGDWIHGAAGNKPGPRTKLSDFTQRLSVTTFHIVAILAWVWISPSTKIVNKIVTFNNL